MTRRVLLADEQAVVRTGLRAVLHGRDGLEIVGECDNGWSAVELAVELSPDVVIMDAVLPRLNGAAATRRIRKDRPGTAVVSFSAYPNERYVSQMLQAGASAYVLKTCDPEELLYAIRAALDGKTYLSPEITGTVVEGYLNAASTGMGRSELTERELCVLQLLAEGKGSKEIAKLLHVSPRTVDSHRHRIMDKLGIHTVAGLTKYAVREGLTPVEY